MKDLFDCFEETYNESKLNFLTKEIAKNKRHRKTKIYYLRINSENKLYWATLIPDTPLNPNTSIYSIIKKFIRDNKIRCSIYTMENMNIAINDKPVKKETWWGRIKVWFSRKFEEFMTTPIDSSLP